MGSRFYALLLIAALLLAAAPTGTATAQSAPAGQICRTKQVPEKVLEARPDLKPEVVCIAAPARQRPAAPARVRPPQAPVPVPATGQICRTKPVPEKVLEVRPDLKPEVVCITRTPRVRPAAPARQRP